MSIGSLRQPALVPGYQVEYRAKVLGEGPEGGVLSAFMPSINCCYHCVSEGPVNPSADTVIDTSERLKITIEELARTQSLLVSGELDPRILEDFRDAVNRVRNTAWAAYQYAESKITGKDSGNIMSLAAAERIRATYQLCQAIQEDLASNDVHLQAGQLIQLHEVTKTLTEKLDDVIRGLK
jgi:hypothetical protein